MCNTTDTSGQVNNEADRVKKPTEITVESILNVTIEKLGSGEDVLTDLPSAGEVTGPQAMAIMRELQSKSPNASLDEIFFCIAMICQKGATSNKSNANLSYKYRNCTITVNQLRLACHKCGGASVRQLARGLKDQIISLMKSLGNKGVPGNLHRSMSLDLPNLSSEEAIWASDFQTYNPNCPQRVRIWLVKNYRARFRNN
jgi:hypothetical protein